MTSSIHDDHQTQDHRTRTRPSWGNAARPSSIAGPSVPKVAQPMTTTQMASSMRDFDPDDTSTTYGNTSQTADDSLIHNAQASPQRRPSHGASSASAMLTSHLRSTPRSRKTSLPGQGALTSSATPERLKGQNSVGSPAASPSSSAISMSATSNASPSLLRPRPSSSAGPRVDRGEGKQSFDGGWLGGRDGVEPHGRLSNAVEQHGSKPHQDSDAAIEALRRLEYAGSRRSNAGSTTAGHRPRKSIDSTMSALSSRASVYGSADPGSSDISLPAGIGQDEQLDGHSVDGIGAHSEALLQDFQEEQANASAEVPAVDDRGSSDRSDQQVMVTSTEGEQVAVDDKAASRPSAARSASSQTTLRQRKQHATACDQEDGGKIAISQSHNADLTPQTQPHLTRVQRQIRSDGQRIHDFLASQQGSSSTRNGSSRPPSSAIKHRVRIQVSADRFHTLANWKQWQYTTTAASSSSNDRSRSNTAPSPTLGTYSVSLPVWIARGGWIEWALEKGFGWYVEGDSGGSDGGSEGGSEGLRYERRQREKGR